MRDCGYQAYLANYFELSSSTTDKISDFNAWIDDIIRQGKFVFVMVREPEEIQQYVERLGATAVFVRRPNADVPMGNDSDDNVENFSYHYYINNDGTVEDLTTRAEEFTNWLLQYV